jgi:TRAP-type uncharacterized transport system substrate-binding protein
LEELPPQVNPQIGKHVKHAIHQEYLALVSLVKFQWPAVLLLLVGILVLIYVVRPFAPSHIKIAVGQPNSSLKALGKKYADYFRESGVTLELVTTAGAYENTEYLKKGKVDAAFSLGGINERSETPRLISLGSVEYQPFWIFHKGDEFNHSNPNAFFENKNFSVNLPGSGTRYLTEKILSMHSIKTVDNKQLVSLSSAESVDALIDGKIDAMFLVAGIESKTVQRLVDTPGIQIFNFPFVQAYAKRLKHLEVVNVPRGSLDIVRDIPNRPIQMVATTTTLLADQDLHPAIQYLFITAARHIDADNPSFFSRPGGFPVYLDKSVPASTVALRYYEKGSPAFDGYAPFWVVSFFDRIWFVFFAIFAVGYPAWSLLPNYRVIYIKLCITDCFDELAVLEKNLFETHTLSDWHLLSQRLTLLDKRSNQLWVPKGQYELFFRLKSSIDEVGQKVTQLKLDIQANAPAHVVSGLNAA